MSNILPSPPDPRDNRAFRDWLYKLYAIINGLDPAALLAGEDSVGTTAAMAAMSGMLAAGQQAAEIAQLRTQVGELQKSVDRMALILAPVAAGNDGLSPMLLAAQTEIGAIRKRIDEVMIWQ